MRKLLISLITVSLIFVCSVDARKKKKKKVEEVATVEVVKVERNYAKYVEANKMAKNAEAEERFLTAGMLYQKAADLTPFGWVEAYRLNDVARMILKGSTKDVGGNPATEDAKAAIIVLEKALALVDVDRIKVGYAKQPTSAAKVINSNLTFCKRVTGELPWPKETK